MIGSQYTTGDGLTLGVSLVLLEIPDEAWIKRVLISAFNTLTIEGNWNDDYGDITADEATRVMSLMLQTLQFDYEPEIPVNTPVGSTVIWHMDTPPDRWLICDGSGVLKASYTELYALFGGKYGESTDYFGLPDLRGRSPFGADFSTELDEAAGALTHTLTTTEIPAHNHGVTDPGHAHRERVSTGANANIFTVSGGSNPTVPSTATTGTLPLETGSATTGISIGSTGGGGAHSILHPVLGVNFIVYAGET